MFKRLLIVETFKRAHPYY